MLKYEIVRHNGCPGSAMYGSVLLLNFIFIMSALFLKVFANFVFNFDTSLETKFWRILQWISSC